MLRYAARFAADWLCLELVTHTLYFNSIAKHHIGLRYREHGLQYGATEMGARMVGRPARQFGDPIGGTLGESTFTAHVLLILQLPLAAMTAFWVLCFMWLKFATIWRFMR